METQSKRCSKCGIHKTICSFHKKGTGLRSACKGCRKIDARNAVIKRGHLCLDCDKIILLKSTRCGSCAQTGKLNHEASRVRTDEENKTRGMKDINNPSWKGGRYLTENGYRYIRVFDHPFSTKTGYMFEHRLVMEKHLGRYLKPEEVVHHIDKDKLNNSIDNLLLLESQKEHNTLHLRAYDFLIKEGLVRDYIKYHESKK